MGKPSSLPSTPEKSRMIAPDILRLFACFSVISIHFFLNSKFYDAPIDSFNMYVMLIARLFFSTCVPLFMILTGYLMCNKTLSKKHYAKGMKVVWMYLLSTLVIVIYRLYIGHTLQNWMDVLWGTLRFNAAPYAWYVEMYLGLYLLIPFLNILYHNINSKRWKVILIITCFALNSLPQIINVYNFVQSGWWSDPSSSTDYQKLIPQWWMYGYPVTYYFIGCYLREYGLNINRWIRRGMLVLSLAAYFFYCMWRASGKSFPWGQWTGWEFPLTMFNAAIIASLVLEKEFRRTPSVLAKVISYLSGLSLPAFLVSYIFDTVYYPILNNSVQKIPDRMWGYFWIVPAVFFSSIAVSIVIDLVYRFFCFLFRSVKKPKKDLIPADSD
ncbi:MAG: acyltransferase family protein [Ruminococcus sp.]|nr:acyltransferase family protein [Ruminococcus sp.]